MGRRWAQPHLKLICFGSFFVSLFFHCTITDWQKNVKQRRVDGLQWWLVYDLLWQRNWALRQVNSLFLIKKKKASDTDLTVSLSCSGIQGHGFASLVMKCTTCLLNKISFLISTEQASLLKWHRYSKIQGYIQVNRNGRRISISIPTFCQYTGDCLW